MTTTEGSLHLGPIYLDDVAIERQKFLDAAALAALSGLMHGIERYRLELPVDTITYSCWEMADAMLLERDRRRAEGKE